MRLAIAKQYIADNVCYAVSVGELAAYCHIGKKQLTRIFLCEEGCTVAEYVRTVRCRHIEKLLKDPSVTLFEISEQMASAVTVIRITSDSYTAKSRPKPSHMQK
jgi:AraC-like DNA-binding protein